MAHTYTYGIENANTDMLTALARGPWFAQLVDMWADLRQDPDLHSMLVQDFVATQYNEMVEPVDMPKIDHAAVALAVLAQMAFFGI